MFLCSMYLRTGTLQLLKTQCMWLLFCLSSSLQSHQESKEGLEQDSVLLHKGHPEINSSPQEPKSYKMMLETSF